MAGLLQPLSKQFKIVDEAGLPTDYFIRWAQQRQIDIGESVSEERVIELVQEALTSFKTSTDINAGLGLSGGGNLTSDVTIDLDATLNDLTNVDTITVPPTDGQALVYSLSSGLWKPGSVASGGGSKRYYAAGLFTGVDTGSPVIAAQYNVTSLTKTAVGRWRVTFTTPLPSTNFGVNASGRFGDFNDFWTTVVGIDRHPGFGFTTTSIDFEFNTSVTPSSTVYDPKFFSFEIYDPTVTTGGGGGGGGLATTWGFSGLGLTNPAGASVTVTGGVTGSPSNGLRPEPTNSWYWGSGGTTGVVTFDFGVPVKLNGIGFLQDTAATQGTWQVAVSSDNITFTNVGTAGTWGGAPSSYLLFTNTTSYRYYRLTQTGGTTNSGPFQRQFLFGWVP